MPRFNPERWKPVDDSSGGYRTLDPTCVVLNVGFSGDRMGCPCGCGQFPKGDKRIFAIGHDSRMRGILLRAHLMGVRIRFHVAGVLGDPLDPYELAEQYYWKSYLDSAVMRREGKNREVLRRTLGSDRLVKVGRWEYTGQICAVYRLNGSDMFEIEYVNQAGDARKVRVAADDTRVAN